MSIVSIYRSIVEWHRSCTAEDLASDSFRMLQISAFHPCDEQEAIVAFIDSMKLLRFDALTAEAQRAIDLLQERRTALISAAVTGKIDVRGMAEAEAA